MNPLSYLAALDDESPYADPDEGMFQRCSIATDTDVSEASVASARSDQLAPQRKPAR
jgi:hypothetical protein